MFIRDETLPGSLRVRVNRTTYLIATLHRLKGCTAKGFHVSTFNIMAISFWYELSLGDHHHPSEWFFRWILILKCSENGRFYHLGRFPLNSHGIKLGELDNQTLEKFHDYLKQFNIDQLISGKRPYRRWLLVSLVGNFCIPADLLHQIFLFLNEKNFCLEIKRGRFCWTLKTKWPWKWSWSRMGLHTWLLCHQRQ
jgi:hypothetical protein